MKKVTTSPNGTTTEESNEEQSSMKISRNAKGDFAWEVKVYGDNVDIAEAKLKEYCMAVGNRISEM